jgi:hypothetical protein
VKPVAAKVTDFRLPLKHPVLYLHWLSSHISKTVFFGIFVCSQSGNQPLEDVEKVMIIGWKI